MSATLELSKPATQSLREQIHALSESEKDAVFLQLLDEKIRNHPHAGDIPVMGPDGVFRGCFVTPESALAAARKFGPQLTDEERLRYASYSYSEETSISMDEMLAEVKAIEQAVRQKRQSADE